MTVRKNGGDGGATTTTLVPPVREVENPVSGEGVPPSRQQQHTLPVQKMYPRLPPTEDDGFEYFDDTPTKPRPQTRGKPPVDEDLYDREDFDEETPYKKSLLLYSNIVPDPPPKRPHFEIDFEDDEGLELSSPPVSPAYKKPKGNLSDPFTPPKQITSTPHTPPETRPVPVANKSPSSSLLPLSYSLLHQLGGYANTLGNPLWQSLREHLLRCGRVADGAVKGRDAARAVGRKRELRIEELERRVRILEAEREVDRAVIGALKRNVDVLTGKVTRSD